MPYQHRIKGTLVTFASLITLSPQADMAYKSNTLPTHTQAVTTQAQSTQGKANRLLSGTVAYGTQYWSYAKVDWMEPIWHSQGKQLYTSLDYMNHLHKSNRRSHEIGSGLVLWQSLTSGSELGLGAYWLNYNSWHDLRHHGLRLGAKVIWQDWQLTGNGFFKLSKTKQGKPGQQMHPYFGSGPLGDEQILNGADMIIGKHLGRTHWQAMAYHYPKQPNQTSQLLSTGLGLEASITLTQAGKPYQTTMQGKILFDKHHKELLTIGIIQSIGTHHNKHITKSDTDANISYNNDRYGDVDLNACQGFKFNPAFGAISEHFFSNVVYWVSKIQGGRANPADLATATQVLGELTLLYYQPADSYDALPGPCQKLIASTFNAFTNSPYTTTR